MISESLASSVGVVVAGQVSQLTVKFSPSSISEVRLRAMGRTLFHGRADGRGRDRVDEAGTDSARRVIGPVALLNVFERMSGAQAATTASFIRVPCANNDRLHAGARSGHTPATHYRERQYRTAWSGDIQLDTTLPPGAVIRA